MIENLVFSSGGIMGYAFIGTYKYLEEHKLIDNIKNIAGCSTGSIMALNVSLGFSSNEIEKIAKGIDFSKLVNQNNNILDMVDNYGYENGEYLIKILKILLKTKTNNEDITFKEHYELFKKKLIIVGCNFCKIKVEYFNHKTQPDMKIWEAIRISCSIPLLFTPYKYKDCLYVDGALIEPCPTNYFKDQKKTLGILLNSNNKERNESTDFKTYLSNLIFFNIRNSVKRKKQKKNNITINLNKYNDLSNFKLSDDLKDEYIKMGYEITKDKLPEIIKYFES
jgi:NTE family protein|uniref:Patatin-like phospholipase n=1 Tax=Mimiviridae sp. ChoanoV1 TaxID=2596887 RepID=A0A5B8HWS9_9VIRU|nr:patatin-like phospholipase [Mimiviridae sp. ChoanoV1]